MDEYYTGFPGCGGRSVHSIATQVSITCDEARGKVREFINAGSENEIIWTKNSTESIATVAHGFKFKKDDVVLITDKEHNSNLVPWHILRDNIGISLKVVKSERDNTFDIEGYKSALNDKVKLVSFYHTSNIDGYTLPAKEIIEIAHDAGARVLLDAAQSTPRQTIDVKRLDVDFLVFSLHKMCGPSGLGVLYGKEDELRGLEPLSPGGDSVSNTTYESTKLLGPPRKFEGGIQNYAGIAGAGAAADYISKIGPDNINHHEMHLNTLLSEGLKDLSEISILGPQDPHRRGGICSFYIRGLEPHDIAMILDDGASVMVRSGTMCAHSWFNSKGLKGCVRVSFYAYNNESDVAVLLSHLKKIVGDLTT